MTTKNLLVELFVEELPPKALKELGEAFAATVAERLKAAGLVAKTTVSRYASPRRLAVHLTDVAAKAADRRVTQKLMPAAVGLDADGNPTPALLKKLAALGKDAAVVPSLKRQLDGKAEALFLDSVLPGMTLQEGLQAALDAALASLPIPKVMSYQLQDGWTTVHFVRPAHRLVALHGAEVVPVAVLGLTADRKTQGHRFEASANPVVIREADSYAEQLEAEGAVIPGFAARRAEIERQLQAAAAREGLVPIADDALLDEVTALVERPNVLVCQFEKEFLDVPQECLILTMKANQKYFPLLDAAGKLTNKFLVVANIRPHDPAAVIGGNERVVRPRLADAKFFFDQDRKKSLIDRIPGLAKVVYHNKLGSQGERAERVARLAHMIGERLGSAELANAADRAALLSKADLLTDMVGEFPELQGIMGRYYALHDGEPVEIADAIEDHYKPRFAGDGLPRNDVGLCVALADKLETLVGLFGIDEKPTGDKDPFALRRHALGVLRMLIEKELALPLDELIEAAFAVFPTGMLRDARGELMSFVFERLAGLAREYGHTAQEVDAVLSLQPMRIDLVPKRLAAVRAFARLPEAESLAAANKRVGNILKKAQGIGLMPKVDPLLFEKEAERALHAALVSVGQEADALFELGDYAASLSRLSALKTPVDRFFDEVMVNVEDARLRANRLGLLAKLHQAMNRVADLARLAA
ncbi:glycine--tRNA ligase subunit beta [Sulfuricystis multivorans]|uniref:glycine--tRNA ligase subunit beta n=1 Tax=Sulfuricystis multivorans TaxID=2211108 RepID=UPI000F8309CA|nr:glycine--tRNA ligase subunit beta [Sulfuricystis multivorans]